MDKFIFNQCIHHPRNLDSSYFPIEVGNQAFIKAVKKTSNYEHIVIALVRDLNQVSISDTIIFHHEHNQDEANKLYIDRLIKTLLWLKGGYKIFFWSKVCVSVFERSLSRKRKTIF